MTEWWLSSHRLVMPAAAATTIRRVAKQPAGKILRIEALEQADQIQVSLFLSMPQLSQPQSLMAPPALVLSKLAPHRVYIDLPHHGRLPKIAFQRRGKQAVLQQVRAAMYRKEVARVVLELTQPLTAKSTLLRNPHRLLLTLKIDHPSRLALAKAMPPPSPRKTVAMPPSDVAVNGNHSWRVVIDPGHGGFDSGAISANGVREKDVVLAIAKNIAGYMKNYGIETWYTRNEDVFVSLESRTLYANKLRAHAFVSIHANSAPNKEARGIETYYLNVTDDRYSIRLAARENKTSEEKVDALRLILADLSTKANSQESAALAAAVQNHLLQAARQLAVPTRNLGVKASLFYVLLGAQMPAILVETAFLSNRMDTAYLTNPTTQQQYAKAIAKAVASYLLGQHTIKRA